MKKEEGGEERTRNQLTVLSYNVRYNVKKVVRTVSRALVLKSFI